MRPFEVELQRSCVGKYSRFSGLSAGAQTGINARSTAGIRDIQEGSEKIRIQHYNACGHSKRGAHVHQRSISTLSIYSEDYLAFVKVDRGPIIITVEASEGCAAKIYALVQLQFATPDSPGPASYSRAKQ